MTHACNYKSVVPCSPLQGPCVSSQPPGPGCPDCVILGSLVPSPGFSLSRGNLEGQVSGAWGSSGSAAAG